MMIIMLVYKFIILTTDCGKFHFLSRAGSFCISRWEWEKGVELRALALHYPIFPVFSTYPPYFLLTFSKRRSYLVFRKRFYYLRNILFSFYEQSVQKNFKTSRCFAMAQHHFLESRFQKTPTSSLIWSTVTESSDIRYFGSNVWRFRQKYLAKLVGRFGQAFGPIRPKYMNYIKFHKKQENSGWFNQIEFNYLLQSDNHIYHNRDLF